MHRGGRHFASVWLPSSLRDCTSAVCPPLGAVRGQLSNAAYTPPPPGVQEDVRKALGVGDREWAACNMDV